MTKSYHEKSHARQKLHDSIENFPITKRDCCKKKSSCDSPFVSSGRNQLADGVVRFTRNDYDIETIFPPYSFSSKYFFKAFRLRESDAQTASVVMFSSSAISPADISSQ